MNTRSMLVRELYPFRKFYATKWVLNRLYGRFGA